MPSAYRAWAAYASPGAGSANGWKARQSSSAKEMKRILLIRPHVEVCHSGMSRKRATRKRRAGAAAPAALGELLGDVARSPHVKPRRKLVNFLVSEAEFEEMHGTAESLGLTLSGYLRGLHRAAVDALHAKRGRRNG